MAKFLKGRRDLLLLFVGGTILFGAIVFSNTRAFSQTTEEDASGNRVWLPILSNGGDPSDTSSPVQQVTQAEEVVAPVSNDVSAATMSEASATSTCSAGAPAFVQASDSDGISGIGLSMWTANGDGTFSIQELSFAGFDRDNVNSEVFGGDTLSATYFGDVNQDGMLDIVHVTEYNNNSIYVYLNKGNNTFVTTPIVTTGMQRGTDGYIFAGISSGEEGWLGDTNRDGKLDYIFSGNDSNVHVYLGNGDGTFAKTRITALLSGAKVYGTSGISALENFFVEDVNRDGAVDMVGAFYESSTSRMQVWLGKGDGTFNSTLYFNALLQDTGASDSSGEGGEEYSQLADVNGDGKLDYLHAEDYDLTPQVWAFLNNGNGTFQTTAVVTNIATRPFGIFGSFANWLGGEESFFADVTNDGRVDYITSYTTLGSNNGLSVYIGNGNGTFAANPVSTKLDNFDTGANSLQMSYVGCGVVAQPEICSNGMDDDHDGLTDGSDPDCGLNVQVTTAPMCSGKLAFVHGSDYAGPSGQGLSIWFDNGNGTFSRNTASIDLFDRDNVGSEVFGNDALSATYFGDVNQDGMVDVVHTSELGGNAIYVYLSKGYEGFSSIAVATTGMQDGSDYEHFAGDSLTQQGWLRDTNRDGKLDYIFSGNDDNIHVYLGNGDGTFAKTRITSKLSGTNIIYHTSGTGALENFMMEDVNGDGAADLVGTFYESSTSRVQVWLGNGNGSFSSAQWFNALLQDSGASDSSGLANLEYSQLADVNRDGKLDYLHAESYDLTAQIWAFLNKGDGTFQTSALVTTITNYPTGLRDRFANFTVDKQSFFADANYDGAIDYISTFDSAGVSSGIAVYPGKGDGTFSNNQIMTPLPGFETGGTSLDSTYLGCGFLPTIHLSSLKGVSIPEDSNIANFVADKNAAKILGKALFWDTAVGSDGQTACASCHFHAGADARIKNQLNPNTNNTSGAPANATYNPTRSGSSGGVNYRLNSGDFPFYQLSDPNDRNSQIVFQTDDVASSQGVYSTRYVDTTPGNNLDQCERVFDGRYHIGATSTRRVEPRNTPTMINAFFNLRNFWDGRANETFNGVSPFGSRDKDAGIYRLDTNSWGVSFSKIQPNLYFSSLASQAVGPPLSDFEMSCAQRLWPNVGRRLLSRYALQGQEVAYNDSLLANYRGANGTGLNLTYQQLIDMAFKPEYRNNNWVVSLGGVNYKMSEANFSFFFGLAVQLYESTLVSDDAPIDRYLKYGESSALTEQERRGMKIFTGKGKCTSCHSGPQLTNAGTPAIEDFKQGAIVSHMILGDGQPAIYDEGFYNIGVRPTFEDLGVGGTDPFGNPLSFAAQYKAKLQTGKAFVDPRLTVNPCTFDVYRCVTPPSSVRTAVDGAFKVPTLRNVELTGPYFHNGGRSMLEQIVEFYNRGGDRRGSSSNNTTGFGSNGSNLDADIEPLGLSYSEKADLVAFLKRPLTDNRVRCEQAPFDHPQLTIANGHTGNTSTVYDDGTGRALNDLFTVPAVGANGICAADLSGRLLSFEEVLAADGISANGRDSLPGNIPDFVSSTPVNGNSPMLSEPAVSEVPVESITIPDAAPIVIEENVEAVQLDENGNELDPNAISERVFLPLLTR